MDDSSEQAVDDALKRVFRMSARQVEITKTVFTLSLLLVALLLVSVLLGIVVGVLPSV